MKYSFLFPSEPYSNNKQVDSSFIGEYNICKTLGYNVFLFDYDLLIEENKFKSNISNDIDTTFIYRGWMFKPEQYDIFFDFVIKKTNNKSTLISQYYDYRNLHCFPFIYHLIKDYTPKIQVIGNYKEMSLYESVLKNINFDFFLKDYVKSIKTDTGVERIDKNILPIDLFNKVNDFIEERGNLFTIGIVLKEFVNLKKIDNKTNEWRTFVLDRKVVCTLQNSELNTTDCPPSELINTVCNILIPLSGFFTVDFAQLEDNSWVVIETGDGQVSGISNESDFIKFYNNINNE